jgi:hypothetical protein
MKKLKITKKIPEYSAYLWDGTIESFYALNKAVGGRGGRLCIEFHLNDFNSWLKVQDTLLIANVNNDGMVFAGQYILLADDGVEVLTEEQIKRRFDIVEEHKIYTGALSSGALDAWNNSTIRGPLENEDGH